jgi:hypothetical protein
MLFVSLLLSDPLAGQILNAFAVSDWGVSTISRVGSEVNVCNCDLPVDRGSSPVSLELGPHNLTFDAANDFEFILACYSVSVTVIAAATFTPSKSALTTASLIVLHSLAPYPTPRPTRYPVVLSWMVYYSWITFNVRWPQGNSLIRTSYWDDGWEVYVHVG